MCRRSASCVVIAALVTAPMHAATARPGVNDSASRHYDRQRTAEQPVTMGLPAPEAPVGQSVVDREIFPAPSHGLEPHYQDSWSGKAPQVEAPPASSSQYLDRLKTLSSDRPEDAKHALRMRGIREEGLRLGIRIGLAERYTHIESMLEANAPLLDQSYNFNPLLIDDVVLPPVIHEANAAFNRVDQRTARAVRTTLRIEYPARIVALAPTWREFLLKRFEMPEDPNAVLLPRDSREQRIWQSALEDGWTRGQVQADRIYESSLAVLTRTLEGMVRYRVLLARGMVSKPDVRTNDLGIVHDGKTLNVGDVIYTLEGAVDFTHADQWLSVPEERRPMRQ